MARNQGLCYTVSKRFSLRRLFFISFFPGECRPMNIVDRQLEDVIVLDVEEDRFEYPKTMVLKNHANHLFQQGHKYLVLNLKGVAFLDSFGLAVIISLLKECKSRGGNLTLFGLSENVTKLIEVTRLDRVLDIWPTEGQAVAHIKD